MSTPVKPLVLVLGATGPTGKSIVQGLLKSDNFRVAAFIRPNSVAKAATEELRASGVEIRVGSLTDSFDTLKKAVEGVTVLISAVSPMALEAQKEIFRAAKEAGVQRVIPCDFTLPVGKGVVTLNEIKEDIHQFIKDLGLGYTFIEVGWWMQLYLPLPLRSAAADPIKALTWQVHGDGQGRVLVTDVYNIGTYVARIIADPRTLNESVIIWEEEVTQTAAHELGERLSGEGEKLKAKRIHISADELKQAIASGREEHAKEPTSYGVFVKMLMAEYMYTLHILEDSTLEKAKGLGYLDVQGLYADIKPHTLEEIATKFYASEKPEEIFNRDA